MYILYNTLIGIFPFIKLRSYEQSNRTKRNSFAYQVATILGCTIAGLNEMEHQGFSSSLIKGIVASYIKIGT
jgi:pyrroline-5-carboxylate reductase